MYVADPSSHAVLGVGLRPFACWICGFESRRGHKCPVQEVPKCGGIRFLRNVHACLVNYKTLHFECQ
jgi:hypothetical protein